MGNEKLPMDISGNTEKNNPLIPTNAIVAQLAAHLTCNEVVGGSIPLDGSIAHCAQQR